MVDGALIYRADTNGHGVRRGELVRIRVRECPDPAKARQALEEWFRQFNPQASVAWSKE